MSNEFAALNVTNSTIFDWHGTELRTTQDPFIGLFETGVGEVNLYKAMALDAEGNEYEVYWNIINDDAVDESEACDWDNPISVVRMTKLF